MRRAQEKKRPKKTEADYTDEQRAWYAKWIKDNECEMLCSYLGKYGHLIHKYTIPDLTWAVIVTNELGGMEISHKIR